jgi:hypothetical protein
MVNINLEITKKHLVFLSLIVVFFIATSVVVAFNSDYDGGNPPIFGHSADELFIRGDTSMQVWADSVEARLDSLNIGTIDTSILDGKLESSSQENSLISLGCRKRNNEDSKYNSNTWMSCPKGHYVAAITDDRPANQDIFCCPLNP